MKRHLGLLLFLGLSPHWLLAQMSTDTCCRPARSAVTGPGPHLSPAPVPTVLPTCYPPVLAVAEPLLYDPTQPALPVFAWKSGAPIYAIDEQFHFRLIALPSNTPLLEQTTASHRIDWPPALVLPPHTTQLRYTVHASRQDQDGQRCFSADTQGTVQLRPGTK